MPTLEFTDFRGEIPRMDERQLPINAASFAQNIRIDAGVLGPIQKPEKLPAEIREGIVKTIFFYERAFWFSWADEVNAINSPIANDDYKRVYFSGDGVPKVTSNTIATGGGADLPNGFYSLGVPAPELAPIVSVTNAANDPDDFSDDETRYYWVTYVTLYGEEGGHSDPSEAVEINGPGHTIELTLPIPSSNPWNLNRKRIYRGVTSGDGTYIQFVAEVGLAQATFIDTVETVGDPIETAGFLMPPSDMKGMTSGINGMVAGFVGNQLVLSEPFLPYAYPESYKRTVYYPIVAVAPTTAGFAVLTEGYPSLFAGYSPDSLTETKGDKDQACVSSRSVATHGGVVVYASPDGLVAFSEGTVTLLTKKVFTKREWSTFKPETIHGYVFEDKYIGFYGDENDTGEGEGGFIFDLASGDLTRIDTYATAAFVDVLTDSLYLVVRELEQNSIYRWEGGATTTRFTWRSKRVKTADMSFSCCRVHTDEPRDISIKIFADDKEVVNLPSLSDEYFRLPALRAGTWQVEVTGKSSITKVALSTSMKELI